MADKMADITVTTDGEQIAQAIEAKCMGSHRQGTGLCPECADAARIAREFKPAAPVDTGLREALTALLEPKGGVGRNLRHLIDGPAAKHCVVCDHVKHNELAYCQVGQCACSTGTPVGNTASVILRDLLAVIREHPEPIVIAVTDEMVDRAEAAYLHTAANGTVADENWTRRSLRAALTAALTEEAGA